MDCVGKCKGLSQKEMEEGKHLGMFTASVAYKIDNGAPHELRVPTNLSFTDFSINPSNPNMKARK